MNELLVPKFNRASPQDYSLKKIFEKVSLIISEKYSADMVFRSFSTKGTIEEATLKKLLINNNPLKLAGKYLFPVIINSTLNESPNNYVIGFMQLTPSKNLTKIQLLRIKDILDLLLMQNITDSKVAQSLNSVAASISTPSCENNVIPFNNQVDVDIQNEYFLGDSEKLPSDTVFIYSSSPSEISKMAFEIHLNSKRFAFLNINDISAENLNFEDFKSMGEMNVFIPNLINLDLHRQLLLKKVLLMGPQFEFPRLITGSTRDFSYIKKYNLIDSELLGLMSSVNLYMNKNFVDYKKAGLIDRLL